MIYFSFGKKKVDLKKTGTNSSIILTTQLHILFHTRLNVDSIFLNINYHSIFSAVWYRLWIHLQLTNSKT